MSFDCSTCRPNIKKLRRCGEDREFTTKDNQMWPMYVNEGGQGYPWCPGKATWDRSAVAIYRSLVVCAESGNLWEAGGIADQPAWFVDLLAWFLPRYNDHKFNSRARSILGDPKVSSVMSNKPDGIKKPRGRTR